MQSTALKQAAAWLRWSLNERRAHVRSLLDVFEITNLDHPAKRNQVELLAPLQLRSTERGVRALEVCPRCNAQMWVCPCAPTKLLPTPTLKLNLGFSLLCMQRKLSGKHFCAI